MQQRLIASLIPMAELDPIKMHPYHLHPFNSYGYGPQYRSRPAAALEIKPTRDRRRRASVPDYHAVRACRLHASARNRRHHLRHVGEHAILRAVEEDDFQKGKTKEVRGNRAANDNADEGGKKSLVTKIKEFQKLQKVTHVRIWDSQEGSSSMVASHHRYSTDSFVESDIEPASKDGSGKTEGVNVTKSEEKPSSNTEYIGETLRRRSSF